VVLSSTENSRDEYFAGIDPTDPSAAIDVYGGKSGNPPNSGVVRSAGSGDRATSGPAGGASLAISITNDGPGLLFSNGKGELRFANTRTGLWVEEALFSDTFLNNPWLGSGLALIESTKGRLSIGLRSSKDTQSYISEIGLSVSGKAVATTISVAPHFSMSNSFLSMIDSLIFGRVASFPRAGNSGTGSTMWIENSPRTLSGRSPDSISALYAFPLALLGSLGEFGALLAVPVTGGSTIDLDLFVLRGDATAATWTNTRAGNFRSVVNPALAFDSKGRALIAFTESVAGSNRIRLLWSDSKLSTWTQSVVASDAQPSGFVSINIGASGSPVIGYTTAKKIPTIVTFGP